jgi:hypothetical protein
MTQPTDLSDIIATSEGVITSAEGSSRALLLELGKPFCPHRAHVTWYCSYRIQLGTEVVTESSMAGTDGIEALTNALVALGAFVEDLRTESDVRFYGYPRFAPEFFFRAGRSPTERPE